jgi:Mg2+-importing ATPase
MQTLKNLFRAFLRSHRLAGLFGRRPMPAGGPSTAVTVPPAQVQALQSAACSPWLRCCSSWTHRAGA